MMSGTSEPINYWPAYVDALINVVLNLLFLVGVFTIGLVSLNGQALFMAKAANERKLAALTAAKTPEVKQRLKTEMLRPSPALPVLIHRPPALLDASAASEQPRIAEIHLKAPTAQAAIVPSPSVVNAQQAATANAASMSFSQYMASLSKGGEIHRISFDINQYKQPADGEWPSEVQARAAQKSWSLFVIADPNNPRLSREAFARLSSIRTVLLNAGALPAHIQLKVIPPPESVALPDGIDRTVWVIERAI